MKSVREQELFARLAISLRYAGLFAPSGVTWGEMLDAAQRLLNDAEGRELIITLAREELEE